MEWKETGTDIISIGRAKVEAQRKIAEQLEILNKTMDIGFGLIVDGLREMR